MAWEKTTLDSVDAVLSKLLQLERNLWLCRGHSDGLPEKLLPRIDRTDPILSLEDKRAKERACIETFRRVAQPFDSRERQAMRDDFVALMVLQHHGVPTRMLDWSGSPYVAACFACADHLDKAGEVVAFDRLDYEEKGKHQWREHPETTVDRSGRDDRFQAGLTAFMEEPPPWFMCAFYEGFQRQDAQRGAYSFFSRFGKDHFDAIENLLQDNGKHHRYVIPPGLKKEVRQALRDRYGVWYGSLFPDTSGAADFVRCTCFGPRAGYCPDAAL